MDVNKYWCCRQPKEKENYDTEKENSVISVMHVRMYASPASDHRN